MFLRRAFVEGRRPAPRFFACPFRLLHAPTLPTLKERTTAFRPLDSHTPSHVVQATQDARPSGLQGAIDRFYEAVTARHEHGSIDHLQLDDIFKARKVSSRTASDIAESYQEKFCQCIVLLAQNRSLESDKVLDNAVKIVSRVFPNQEDDYAERIATRLIGMRDTQATFRWLTALQRTQLECVTYGKTRKAWHALLELAAELRDVRAIHNILSHMRSIRIWLTRETSTLIFQAMFDQRARPNSPNDPYLPPPFSTIKRLIDALHVLRVPYDENSLRSLVDGYTRGGQPYLADEAEDLYVSTMATKGRIDPNHINKVLAHIASRQSRISTTQAYRRFKATGFRPSVATLLAVLSSSTHISDLTHWQNELRVRATPAVIEQLIERRAQSSAPVLELYAYAKDQHFPLTAPMLYSALRSLLTSAGLQKPTERAIDAALDLYRDFIAYCNGSGQAREPVSENEVSTEGPSVQATHPNAATYQLLLRALTTSHNMAKYLPVAVSVIGDMSHFGIGLDYQTTASILMLLMGVSPSPEEAFRMYTIIGRPPPNSTRPVLNQEGYATILHTFCTLPTWPDGIPSATLYFEILADMRKYGVYIGPKVYTIILAQLGKLATAAYASHDTARREVIAKTITRIHNYLTVNPQLTPDTALYNQLMDAYQRTGHFIEACRIWQLLYASSQFNNASVSIILDACAFARAYDMAVRVYDMLKEAGWPLNVKNWNTYVECLCRLGRLDEAMKVVCLEMVGRKDGVEPDKESVRILLKFAVKANQEAEVRSRIKRFLPKLYASIPAIIQGSL
ncbi:hypothetical protein GY45DRAFT_1326671 [Cubamyces sp. BRFM 1775]|nr:hypothetical protein GY45DRAFT_1326671 [Cubamyces sp. BRFM 1775]